MSGMPDIESSYAGDYKRVNISGVFGGVRPYGVEAIVYSDTMDVKKVLETQPLSPDKIVIKRTAECCMIIDPIQLKSIVKWLQEKVTEYEKLFGKIASAEDLESRSRESGQ